MKTTFKKILCLVLIIGCVTALSFGLVACNNDESVITVGYTLFQPMNYNDDNGHLTGFDTELAKKVFEDLGYKVAFKEIKWENKYLSLDSDSINCIWNGFTYGGKEDDGTAKDTLVDFSYRYMQNYQAVVINKADASSITSIASLSGKIGKVEAGSAGETYAKTFAGANLTETKSQTDALSNLNGDGCDFVVVDYLLANSIVGKGDFSSLMIVDGLNSDKEFYAVGFKKGSDLTAKVNAKFKEYATDGSLLALATKYGLENALITDFAAQD